MQPKLEYAARPGTVKDTLKQSYRLLLSQIDANDREIEQRSDGSKLELLLKKRLLKRKLESLVHCAERLQKEPISA